MTPETPSPEALRDHYASTIESNSLDGHYRNYGDATPEGHGGIWIAYDIDRRAWDVWITTHAAEVGLADPDAEDPGLQYIETAEIDFVDVVGPDGEWSDTFDHIPETYHNGHRSPLGAIVDRELTAYVAHEARKWADPYPRIDPVVHEDSYEAVLDRFGIEPRDE